MAEAGTGGFEVGAVYALVNPNSGKAMRAKGAGTSDGTKMEIFTVDGSTDQQWKISGNNNGTYTLISQRTGKVLDVDHSGTTDGTKVHLWSPNGSGAQQWKLNPNNDGTYTLINPNSGKALDIAAAGTADGTPLQIYSSNGTVAQKWKLTPVSLTPTDPTNPTDPNVGPIDTSDTPDFGPNVKIYDQATPVSRIQAEMAAAFEPHKLNPTSQFGNQRFAFFFKPGTYSGVQANLGFYTAVSGLGKHPDDVHIVGNLTADYGWNAGDTENVTQNFWRSIENLKITPNGGLETWAVSQAAPMRRVHVAGDLRLFPTNVNWGGTGWASGGFLADSKVDGAIKAGSQQQWYTRESTIGGWENSVWNMVFSGVQGAPAQEFSPTGNRYTTLATTPISREKPYMYVDGSGKYFVFNPSRVTNSSGASWLNGNQAGSSIPMSKFYVAKPADSTAKLNAALDKGLNLLLTPGIYNLTASLKIKNPNTIVLGVGFPTLVPNNGVDGLTVADVDGVRVAGILFDAGTTNSNALMTVGVKGSGVRHIDNPTTVQDVYFRIGGAVAGKATNSLIVNSNDTIIDHIWAWRADHGTLPTGWNINTADYGVIVNGDSVLATGLLVEHYQKFQVLWNGNNGKTIFFQNEMPYDIPNQESWNSAPGVLGYASYKVADNVTNHEAWGLGAYIFSTVNYSTSNHIKTSHAFEVPRTNGVRMHDLVTVSLHGFGEITHIINDQGEAAPDDSTNTSPHLLQNYP
ncbi:MAG: RICIN domain-containing protein [Pseudomonadota bacterium]